MRKSYLIAAAILVLVVLWLASGMLTAPEPDNAAPTEAPGTEAMAVQTRDITAEPYTSDLIIQGRTEAVRTVELKSQIDGFISALPVEKGQRVNKGDLICVFAVEERAARLAEAEALAAQRELEYNAAVELAEKGHRSRTQVANARAQYDAAQALVAQMNAIMGYTEIRAPFDGVIDRRPAELGDYLLKGSNCATILDLDPYLVIGHASERTVGRLSVGDAGTARMIDGSRVEGRIRYIASAAEPETRTFRVELEVANPDMRLRHGVTAEIRIPGHQRPAHFIPPSALVLDDEGKIGVRLVEEETVRFRPVEIIGDRPDGVWVDGLARTARLIVVGQQFVTDGDRVEVHEAGDAPPPPDAQ